MFCVQTYSQLQVGGGSPKTVCLRPVNAIIVISCKKNCKSIQSDFFKEPNYEKTTEHFAFPVVVYYGWLL